MPARAKGTATSPIISMLLCNEEPVVLISVAWSGLCDARRGYCGDGMEKVS